ncbi:MAG: glycosyltransferase [Acutalibacteraceae bacterium]
MSNRTICLINDSFPPVTDGVANAVVNYGRAITESGSRAVVATPAYPGADDSGFSFPVVRYPSIDMTKLVGYHAGFPFSEKTMQTLMEYPFDLIHCHCPITSAVLARELRARIHVPAVFTYHTKFDIDIANAIHAKLLQEGAKKAARRQHQRLRRGLDGQPWGRGEPALARLSGRLARDAERCRLRTRPRTGGGRARGLPGL